MPQRTHPPRLRGRSLFAAALGLALVSCTGSDGTTLPPGQRAAALQVISRNPQPGIAGQRLPEKLLVRVVDKAGNGVQGVNVAFTVSAGGGSITPASETADAGGYVQVAWRIGSTPTQTATASTVGVDGVPLSARIVQVPVATVPMLGTLAEYIPWADDRIAQALPNNPQAASFMQARLALLRTPGLGGDIIDTHRYAQGSVPSRSGVTLPVTAVFPVEAMRGEAEQSIRVVQDALPVLESWLGLSYPMQFVRIWYGFVVGSAGGGGYVHAEDRTTYQARTQGLLLPYEPMIIHEMTHTWMSHEGLNQFLELYGYNMMATGSADARAWTFTRGWQPGREANDGVHALLDIYQLVGPEAMAAGYRAIILLRPGYGQPMSPEARQAFAAAVPEALRAQVLAKLAKVTY
jgi:hypothetical protein